MESADFFRRKADQCRAVAESIADTDKLSHKIRALALEFEARAVAIEAEDAADRLIEGRSTAKPDGGDP